MDRDLAHRRLEHALAIEEQQFGDFFLLRFFGMTVSYGDGTCTVSVPYSDYVAGDRGGLPTGLVALAADVSMGHLCERELSTSVTIDLDLKWLRLPLGAVRCEASFLRRGRRIVQLRSRVTDDGLNHGLGETCAIASASWYRLASSGSASRTTERGD